MGGGGGGGESTVTQTPGGIQVPPEFQDYFKNLGSEMNLNLGRYDLADFAGPNPLQVPGLNDFQTEALGQVYARGTQGIPTPTAEAQLQQNLMPWALDAAGQVAAPSQPNYANTTQFATGQVDPMLGQQYQHAAGTQGTVGQVAPTMAPENQAIATLNQLASGNYGNSPAYQSAVAQIQQFVNPQVGNSMAAMGLGHSGAAASQLQQQQMATLLPLAEQAMRQQESSGVELGNIGNLESQRYADAYNRQLQAENMMNQTAQAQAQTDASLQNAAMGANASMSNTALNANANLQNTFMNQMFTGQNDAYNRQVQAAQGMYSPLLQLGSAESSRQNQSIQDLFNAGALTRDIQGQGAQADYNDLMRRQALAEQFATPMVGQIPAISSTPVQSTETTRTSSSK